MRSAYNGGKRSNLHEKQASGFSFDQWRKRSSQFAVKILYLEK